MSHASTPWLLLTVFRCSLNSGKCSRLSGDFSARAAVAPQTARSAQVISLVDQETAAGLFQGAGEEGKMLLDGRLENLFAEFFLEKDW